MDARGYGHGFGSGMDVTAIKARVDGFLAQFGVEVTILLALMSGAVIPRRLWDEARELLSYLV